MHIVRPSVRPSVPYSLPTRRQCSSFPGIFFQLFFGLRPLWSCGVHRSACLAMLSSSLLSVCPMSKPVPFSVFNWSVTGSWSVFFRSSLLAILSGRLVYVYDPSRTLVDENL